MMLMAAPLIHSRTKYIDFRNNFIARPEDFNVADVKETKRQILSSTASIEELDKSDCRKLILTNGDNVIFGITAYMTYFNNMSNGALENMLFDKSDRRSIYLFVGLVVKKCDLNCAVAFPDDRYFVEAVKQYLIPRWEEMSHDEGSLNATLTQYDVCVKSDEQMNGDTMKINTIDINKTMVFPNNLKDISLDMAIREIVDGNDVSVCTNIPVYEIKQSFFMNATSGSVSENTVLYNAFNVKEIKTDISNQTNDETTLKMQPSKMCTNTNNKKKTQNIAKHLLCIGAIAICGSYVIFADKKLTLSVIIASGMGLTALIAEIIDLYNHFNPSKATKTTEEPKPEGQQKFTVVERKKDNNNKNNDDIFKL